MSEPVSPLKLAVLISGSGTNLQAIIDAIQAGTLPAEIVCVISNKPDAFGLDRARKAGIPAETLDHTRYSSRDEFDTALARTIDQYAPDLIVLAGFMRILTPAFVSRYPGRLLNIHPSLLPKYPGLHTHQRAIESGDAIHGCSIHFVTDELDGGPVIAQAQVPVLPDDTPETLAQRVHSQEHFLYPEVLRWFAAERLSLTPQGVKLDAGILPASGVQFPFPPPDKGDNSTSKQPPHSPIP